MHTNKHESEILFVFICVHSWLKRVSLTREQRYTSVSMSTENWPPHRAREAALQAIAGRIATHPDDVGLRFERAGLLAAMGRSVEARDAYLDVLSREPSHRLALNNLGTLLYSTGYRTAARTAYAEAVERHPGDPMSRVNLANALLESGEFVAAR